MATLQAVTLGLSPYAYYRMNETGGTTLVDSSGNGLDGTYGTGITLNQSPLTTNDAGSPSFPGGSNASYVTTGILNTNPNVTAASQSISVWFKMTAAVSGSFYDLLGNGSPSSGIYKGIGILIKAGASGTANIGFDVRNSAGVNVGCNAPTSAIVANTLYHLVAVIDAVNNVNRLYLNAVSGPTGTYAAPVVYTPDSYIIGAYPEQTTLNIPARIAEGAWFASALSSANVSTLYTAGTTAASTAVLEQLNDKWRLLNLIH